MCLIVFAWRAHPRYDLVLAANRDEFHSRPTEAAHAWPAAPSVFAGRDAQAGGTWCGVGSHGRFAAVTNHREMTPAAAGERSRGHLVSDYLAGDWRARDYCEAIYGDRNAYGGFNLLVGDREDLFYLGNRDERGVYGVPPGIHALSNGVLGDDWPKTRRAVSRLREILGPPRIEPDDLLALLADTRPAPDEELPDTGVDLETERLLSPVFIRSPQYGTRAATVILRGVDGGLRFVERGFDPDGRVTHTVDEGWP